MTDHQKVCTVGSVNLPNLPITNQAYSRSKQAQERKFVQTLSFLLALGAEDGEAGGLGKPFTETEDDEEWTGWD